MDGSIVFARWRQCPFSCGHIGEYNWTCSSFGPPESITQTANRSVQPLLHSSPQKVPIINNGRPFPSKLPLIVGGIWTTSNSWFLGPVRVHNPNCVTIGTAVFAQVTAECPYTLQWAAPALSKLPLPWGIWTQSNTWFLGPPESSIQTASRSVKPFLEGSLVW